MIKRSILFIIAISLFFSSGCLHRKLTVRSDPPGATVYFNDKEIGTTPVEFDFMWYHKSHIIKLEKEGFETLEATESIKAPTYLWMPLDLLAEIMPVKVKDYREFSYELVPKVERELPAQ